MKISICIQPDYSPKVDKNRVVDRIVLNQDWYFIIDHHKFWLPSGYDCDGASIPRALWSIIGSPCEPCLTAPAFAHDIIYLTHCFSRAEADEIFYQLLLCNGLNKYKAKLMWGALRAFAWFAWNNTDQDKQDLQSLMIDINSRQDKEKFVFKG